MMDRRRLLATLGAGVVGASLTACGRNGGAASEGSEEGGEGEESAVVAERDDAEKLTWKDARKRLEHGNLRFAEGSVAHPDQSTERRKAIGEGKQRPFASVLACADSRVAPELVFDQGLGDLFVVRTAGQVVDDAVLGTLQFGVAEFGTPLLVVLGHSRCGAVKATIEAVEKRSPPSGTAIDALVAAVTPAVREAEEMGAAKDALLDVAVEANVEMVVAQLSRAKILEVALKSRKVKIVGAVYDIESGEVTFA